MMCFFSVNCQTGARTRGCVFPVVCMISLRLTDRCTDAHTVSKTHNLPPEMMSSVTGLCFWTPAGRGASAVRSRGRVRSRAGKPPRRQSRHRGPEVRGGVVVHAGSRPRGKGTHHRRGRTLCSGSFYQQHRLLFEITFSGTSHHSLRLQNP